MQLICNRRYYKIAGFSSALGLVFLGKSTQNRKSGRIWAEVFYFKGPVFILRFTEILLYTKRG